jgi:2-octaprenyl-6-methoxyphenol hydroxylase
VVAKHRQEIEIAIVGAGPVGATVAALAAGAGLAIEVFEARSAPSTDRRTLALSHASRALLQEAGAWPDAQATPILSIHVSQKGGPGRTLLEAAEQSLPALGYTVPFSAIEESLSKRLEAAGVAVHRGEACDGIALDPEGATLHFASGREVRARLLVLADGGANAAKIPGIAFHEKDYRQHAVVAAVRADRPHGYRAYERFTPQGPIALLPVGERFALVWTAPPEEAKRLLALDEARFAAELQAHFGDRAGRFVGVAERASFPLRLRAVNVPVALRTAIVGNAAHALHPIAGQGLNLGLRDAAALAAAIAASSREQLGAGAMLDAYARSRRRDASRGVAFTDFLVSAFADGRRIPTWGRGLALAAFDLFPPARRVLAERMIHGAPE